MTKKITTKRLYNVEFNYDFDWQSGIKLEASSADAAIAAAKKAAKAKGWSMPRGTKWRARRAKAGGP